MAAPEHPSATDSRCGYVVAAGATDAVDAALETWRKKRRTLEMSTAPGAALVAELESLPHESCPPVQRVTVLGGRSGEAFVGSAENDLVVVPPLCMAPYVRWIDAGGGHNRLAVPVALDAWARDPRAANYAGFAEIVSYSPTTTADCCAFGYCTKPGVCSLDSANQPVCDCPASMPGPRCWPGRSVVRLRVIAKLDYITPTAKGAPTLAAYKVEVLEAASGAHPAGERLEVVAPIERSVRLNEQEWFLLLGQPYVPDAKWIGGPGHKSPEVLLDPNSVLPHLYSGPIQY